MADEFTGWVVHLHDHRASGRALAALVAVPQVDAGYLVNLIHKLLEISLDD